MTATQLSLLDQAKTGDPSAIAALMNRMLSKQGSKVKVKRQSGDYKLLVGRRKFLINLSLCDGFYKL